MKIVVYPIINKFSKVEFSKRTSFLFHLGDNIYVRPGRVLHWTLSIFDKIQRNSLPWSFMETK